MHRTRRSKLLISYALLVLLAAFAAGGSSHALELIELEPSGPIAREIDRLFWTTVVLMSLVLIPVFVMTAWFAWKYRATNSQADYAPEWERSFALECLVWLVPGLIISVLACMTWLYSHRLDPYKPLSADEPPLEIQVVALDWKWLFIYPQQNIASVNELLFPVDRPIDFRLTSATVMNSFFIPRLGGQIYAMAGMETRLHLIADMPGRYLGENTQFSGRGFPRQKFVAVASNAAEFAAWVERVKRSPVSLDRQRFDALAKARISQAVSHYASVIPGLFERLVAEFKTAAADSALPSDRFGASPHVR